MMTTNSLGPDGWGGKSATREFDGIFARNRKEGASALKWLRRMASNVMNHALRVAGATYRVSHLSLAEQRARILARLRLAKDISSEALERIRWDALKGGNAKRFALIDMAIELDREPIGKVGKCAMALERKGVPTRIAEEKLHGPRRRNAERVAAREKLRAQLAAEKARAVRSHSSNDANRIAAVAALAVEKYLASEAAIVDVKTPRATQGDRPAPSNQTRSHQNDIRPAGNSSSNKVSGIAALTTVAAAEYLIASEPAVVDTKTPPATDVGEAAFSDPMRSQQHHIGRAADSNSSNEVSSIAALSAMAVEEHLIVSEAEIAKTNALPQTEFGDSASSDQKRDQQHHSGRAVKKPLPIKSLPPMVEPQHAARLHRVSLVETAHAISRNNGRSLVTTPSYLSMKSESEDTKELESALDQEREKAEVEAGSTTDWGWVPNDFGF